MEIYIDNRQSKVDIDKDIYNLLERVVREALLVEGMDLDYEVSISFVDNEEIRKLNSQYRGVDRETDVLSFPMDEELMVPLPILGDIIISMEKAIEQSKEYGHSLIRELSYLTTHSMFHLMGYDHLEEEDRQEMREKEKQVMKRLEIFRENKGE